MGLSPFDVKNLEEQMSGVGDVFEQRRKDKLAQQRADTEESFRQQMLANEMRRTTAEESGKVSAYLQDDDGNQVSYSGPPEGLDAFVQKTKAAGKNWSPVKVPNKTPYSVKLNLPDGEMELHADDLDTLQNQVESLRKAKATAPKTQPASSSNVQNVGAAKRERASRAPMEAQLDELRQAAASGGPVGSDIQRHIAALEQAIEQSKKDEAAYLQSKMDPTQFETVTETTEPDVTSGGPKVSRSYKVPRGNQPAGAEGLPLPADRKLLVKGKAYKTSRGAATWDGKQFVQ